MFSCETSLLRGAVVFVNLINLEFPLMRRWSHCVAIGEGSRLSQAWPAFVFLGLGVRL
jgi:hypothetical protein